LLWQVSRIPLALFPTHRDRAGGLGLLSNTVYAFVPLVLTLMPLEDLLKKLPGVVFQRSTNAGTARCR
jgi:hypothetical protein